MAGSSSRNNPASVSKDNRGRKQPVPVRSAAGPGPALGPDVAGSPQAVQAERQRFNDILDMLPAYLVLLTPDHHVAFTNRFFRERFGASHGRRCFEYLFGRTEPCAVCETYKVLQTMTPLEWEWTGPDGRDYYIYDFPFTDTDGSTLIMEAGIDITERKQAERALKKVNATLEQRVVERTGALREANAQLQAQAEELRIANEQLQAQREELQAQTEELRAREESLRELNATLETKVSQRTVQLQHRAQQLRKLTLDMSAAEDRERQRLAEILHDDLQQIIAAAKFQLSVLRSRIKHEASLHALALEIDQMLKEAVDKSRSLSHELSPARLSHGDFAETLSGLAAEMRAKHGLVVHIRARGCVDLRSDAVAALLYRTVQELLFNVVKHARVNEARVRVHRRGPWVLLSVSDCGQGFDPQGLRQAAGFGLLSIRERVEWLGGQMKIRSRPDRGSTFLLAVPDGRA